MCCTHSTAFVLFSGAMGLLPGGRQGKRAGGQGRRTPLRREGDFLPKGLMRLFSSNLLPAWEVNGYGHRGGGI